MTGRRTARRWVRVAWAALALGVLLGAACGGGEAGGEGGAAVGADGGGTPDERIVLVRDRRLLLRAADGEERVLFESERSNIFPAFPAWSPDGTRVAFVLLNFAVTADGDWGDDVYVMDATGSAPRLARAHAARGEQVQGLAWTRDGAALLAGVNTPEVNADGSTVGLRSSLQRIDLDSGVWSVLVDGAVEPSLSRDGARLAYLVPGGDGSAAIWTASADGSGAREVTLPDSLNPPFAPRISPDGTSLAFSAPTSGAFSARPARGWWERLAGAVPIAPRSAEAHTARTAHGVPMEVWRVTLADETLTPLTSFGEDDPRSAWESSGEALIVLATNGLYRIRTDGSGVERIDEGAFAGQIDVR